MEINFRKIDVCGGLRKYKHCLYLALAHIYQLAGAKFDEILFNMKNFAS